MRRRRVALLGLIATTTILTACVDASAAGTATAGTTEVVRLGYFPTVTHAPALVGITEGTFRRHLGGTQLSTTAFNAGPEAVEALFADAVDIAYVGPNPAINAFHRSRGEAIRIISGSTSGGAALVVAAGIDDVNDLRGAEVATPQLGNSQDVALRVWLREQGMRTDTAGGGDVSIVPRSNADTLDAFRSGSISAAWVPEPWVSRLVLEGGGTVLVDESDLWPGGSHVTTQVVVRTEFLERHPDLVAAVLSGHLDALGLITENPVRAREATNAGIERISGARLSDEVLARAWAHLTFTSDPLAGTLRQVAADAEAVGLLSDVDLSGIHDLRLLESLDGRSPVGPSSHDTARSTSAPRSSGDPG